MKLITILTSALAILPFTSAQVQTWWQCGGIGWTGPTTCSPGVVCMVINAYYSQCVPEVYVTTNTAGSTVYVPPITQAPPPGCTPSVTARALQPRVTGVSLIALDGWAAGSYLQKSRSGDAGTLGPASTKGSFLTERGIRLIDPNPTSCTPYLYFNVNAASTNYKPVQFESTGRTLSWVFDGPDNTLRPITGVDTFIICSDGALYFRPVGSDVPSGNCTVTRLKIDE
ncbi:hypothetical protein RSOLAG1IB_03840 [Rhizoctonia solani AG-1 IB]|uniref:CBM1 domain-containing protein n=1 Tax=Thanatephorus cucumeris (strain AG1-IB / isolate 7/3/14) TaxID=1108050 RepID=A0A0B7FWR1_THACB|nr:hypothetical protein RSOLAG1IB_03840 [Rhizoctonia solani AG-1 IB]